MDTDQTIDPQTLEPATDTPTTSTEETVSDDTSDVGTEDAAMQKRLADKDRLITELRGKQAPDTRSKEIKDLEWRLDNKERITLVKDEYDKILVDGYRGEKVSKAIALELAEKIAKVDSSGARRDRQNDMHTSSTTNRTATLNGYESPEDEELGLTIDMKRKLEAKHPHLKGM